MAERVVIIGAGLAGSLLAVYLARQGRTVSVFERRPDPRVAGYAGGRSINLALSIRGLWGLEGVGLDRDVLARDAIAMRGRRIHPLGATEVFQPYSRNPGDAINSVSRAGLNLSLIQAAGRERKVEFHFDTPCLDIDLDAPAAFVRGADGVERRVDADLILGADGAFSPVRARLQKTERFEYSQSPLAHGYKELHIPAPSGPGITSEALPGATFALEPHALHIWPRGGSMMIALPNRDGSFTCTLFWPFRGDHAFEALEGPGGAPAAPHAAEDLARVRAFFIEHYPDAVPLMPTLERDFFANPTSSLLTIRCSPWTWKGKVALLGDAAHAIVPFYGQGMNAAFEDVRVLADLLAGHPGDAHAALAAFEAARKPHADAIADMALENFVEMRDRVGDPAFRRKKRVEQELHALIGAGTLSMPLELRSPQYNLVSFSTVPYAEARRRGLAFDRFVERVLAELPPTAEGLAPDARADLLARAAHKVQSTANEPAVIEISPLLSPRTAVFPGDTPLSREALLDTAKGDSITLSTLRATVHLGAHADAPSHYGKGAHAIHEMPLAHYVGRCQVVDAPVQPGSLVHLDDLASPISERRVLIRTGTQPDTSIFPTDFAALDPALVEALADRGVITIGIDTPSVDPGSSKELRAHKAFLRRGVAILEGLVLDGVAPGVYELIAPPLKLEGFDASPVRALLRPVSG
ncbi:MAG: FAD-dependent monooxygenase [Phycisphaerales bacterium]|nr:FAD-dependent monooxygenase [Phycisphaerales bacterium]